MQPYEIKREGEKERGFILPILLLFMQVFILLGLYTLEISVIESKVSRGLWQKEQLSNELEQVLQKIELGLNEQGVSCQIPVIPMEALEKEPLSWWQTETCAGNFHSIQYYYAVESLGEDLCAHVETAKGQVAQYYRISLFGVETINGLTMRMQSTEVLPISDFQRCTDHVHGVKVGRQTWRLI